MVHIKHVLQGGFEVKNDFYWMYGKLNVNVNLKKKRQRIGLF